jgi:hypothetical protein
MIHPILDWLIGNVDEHSLSWYALSNNPNTTFDLVKKYINKPWDWILLSKHKNITFDIIKNNPQYIWDTFAISQNPNITWDIIIDNPNFIWSFKELSCHPNITWNIIKENLETENPFDWDYKVLSFNPNINWDIIINNYKIIKWDFESLIYNHNIYWEMINNNQKIINFLKNNFNDDIDFLFNKLDWLLISQDERLNVESIYYINNNCYITKKQKNNNPNKTNYQIINSLWYYNQIIYNTNFEIDNINNFYNNDNLLLNHNIEIEDINNIINKYWINYLSFNLSKNPKLDIEFFNNNNNKYFCNIGYNLNPNISLDYIKNNINNNINYIYWLCHNQFNYNNYYVSNNYKKKLVKKFMDNCFEELIKKSCCPKRKLNWDDNFMNDCKNGLYGDDYLQEYIKECSKY